MKKSGTFRILLFTALVLLGIVCAAVLIHTNRQLSAAAQLYDSTRVQPEATPAPSSIPSLSSSAPEPSEEVSASDEAPDAPEESSIEISRPVGQIYCPGTRIDYPICQGEDNSYYLDHLSDQTENPSGSIFLDYRNAADFSDKNSLVYGHNMRDDSMFGSLSRWADPNYYQKYPEFYLKTPEFEGTLAIFSVYLADTTGDVYETTFADEESFAAWLEDCRARSVISTTAEPTAEDRIVTLCTCSSAPEKRLIVQCVMNMDE